MSTKFTPNDNIQRGSSNKLWLGFLIRESHRQQAISSNGKLPSSPLTNRHTLLLVNAGTNIIYLGDSTVSDSNGSPLYPHQSININVEDNIDIYACSVTGSYDLRLWEGA